MKLKVTAKRDGFRRAGRAWKGETIVPADKFSKAQIAALKAEPNLVVEEVADDAPQDPDAGKTAKAGGAQTKAAAGQAKSAS